jgi:hypothetical protein
MVAVPMSERRCADQGLPQGDEDRSRAADAGLTRREVVLGGGALALAAALAAALEPAPLRFIARHLAVI